MTPVARAMHAYLDPLLQINNVGQTIAFEDLVSSWKAVLTESVGF